MILDIFDVEHGACALLTCDNNSRIMIDAGHNATSGWKPGDYLHSKGIGSIELLSITNYDEDHVSGIGNLFERVSVGWLSRNISVSANTIRLLKSETGMGRGIDTLVYAIENHFVGNPHSVLEPVYQGLERQVFWNSYPTFDDENNLSMVFHFKCNGIGVLFPGDMERAGWLKLLEQDRFRAALKDTSVFIASHHGRESGCCDEVFEFCKPYYVVISDKGYVYDSQKTLPYYKARTRGGLFRGETRYVLTTRNDGRIGFYFNADGRWGTY